MRRADSAWDRLRRVFRLPATRDRLRQELDEELRFHLEGRVDDLMEREGLSRADAEREARRRFGDYQAYRQETRSIDDTMFDRRGRMAILDAVRRETKRAARALLRAPSFSLIAVLTLALGLGAATTLFTLLDRVVLRPLPYPNADRLIHLTSLWPKIGAEYWISKGQYFYFRRNSGVLADIALFDGSVSVVPADGDHPAERVTTAEVSASTFGLLGIRPERGRAFPVEEETAQNPTVALISHSYWRNRFGGDPAIIGRRLPLGWGAPVEIIGVLPEGASLPDLKADIWVRSYLNPNERPQNNHTHRAIALLKPGVTVAAAASDIQRVQGQMIRDYPNIYHADFMNKSGFAMRVASLRDAVVGPTVVRALWLLFGAVAFVLLIAAANVANLFLVRIDARRREMAVRSALGAGKSQLAVHCLMESLLIAAVAAAGAVALGYALLHTMLAIAPQTLPRLDEVTLDWRSIAFCVGTALAFGIVFGLLPLASAGVDIAVLRDGGRGLSSSRSRELARRVLVLTQVALAVVLLSGATLMAKSFARLRHVNPGFDPTGVQTMTLVLPPSKYLTYSQIAPFWHELTRRVEALPGVLRAGATDKLPLADGFGCTGVVTDLPVDDPRHDGCMSMATVTPGFFEAMGMKVSGTLPTWSSVEAGAGPVVVSTLIAKRVWEDASPIGHVVKPMNDRIPGFPIVGVAEDMRGNGLRNPIVDAIYFPIIPPPSESEKQFGRGWWSTRNMTLVVRAPSANPATLVTGIRRIVADIDPQVPIVDVTPMEVVFAKSIADTSFTMLLLLIASAIAIALSAVGIYGVISYVVGQRRAEIGIRIALGARGADVTRLIVGQSLTTAILGAIIGVIAALAGTRLLGALLFEVSPNDPVALTGTAIALIGVAALASIGPTRRAASIDPVEAMRQG